MFRPSGPFATQTHIKPAPAAPKYPKPRMQMRRLELRHPRAKHIGDIEYFQVAYACRRQSSVHVTRMVARVKHGVLVMYDPVGATPAIRHWVNCPEEVR